MLFFLIKSYFYFLKVLMFRSYSKVVVNMISMNLYLLLTVCEKEILGSHSYRPRKSYILSIEVQTFTSIYIKVCVLYI